MRSTTPAVVAAAMAASLLAITPASATEAGWAQSYGTATVTGVRHTERDLPFSVLTRLVAKGELGNIGTDCYTLWAQLGTGTPTKAATQCGTGTTAFTVRSAASMNPDGTLFLCRGEGTQDCGPGFSLKEFPAGLALSPLR